MADSIQNGYVIQVNEPLIKITFKNAEGSILLYDERGGGGLPHLSVPRCIYFPIEDVSSRPTSEADKMTYTSVVSSGNCLGIAVSFLLRQSAIPSTHLHGFGHVQRSPPTTALQSVSRVSSMPERSSNRLKGRSFKVNVIAGLPKTNRCTIKD